MAAVQGICSPLISQGALPGDAWFRQLDALRPGTPLAIRASLSARPDGTVDVETYKRSLHNYQSRGHTIFLLLEANIGRKAGVNPNATLSPMGNAEINPWIDDYSLTCCDTLNKLGADCPKTVIIGNEVDILADTLEPGQVIPPLKPEALSIPVAALLTWQTASRIHNLCPQIKTIWPPAMSDLIKFDTDPYGPFLGQFVQKQIAYLTSLGLSAPWPWEGMPVNCEGAVTQHYADILFFAFAQVKKQTGITGPTSVTEWGVPAENFDPAVMKTCFNALNGYASHMFFYVAGLDRGYKTWDVSVAAGELIPGATSVIVPFLQEVYQGSD